MSTSNLSTSNHIHPAIINQSRYALRRRLMRDLIMHPIGFRLLIKPHIEGTEHIPAAGPTMLVMNHIAAIDPFVVVGAVTARFVVPMSKIENFSNPFLALIARSWGVYPVRRGEIDRQALASTIALLEQGCPVLLAPEGTRQPALSEAKDGMTYVATKANAVIVPVGVDGTEQFPGSLKRLRRAHVTIRFGRAFRLRVEGRQRIPRDEMREMTRQVMYQLAQLLPEHRRGCYSDLDHIATDRLEFVDP
jgi:1-acyl-sn-glycerol-3-phosphate acyltransferase